MVRALRKPLIHMIYQNDLIQIEAANHVEKPGSRKGVEKTFDNNHEHAKRIARHRCRARIETSTT